MARRTLHRNGTIVDVAANGRRDGDRGSHCDEHDAHPKPKVLMLPRADAVGEERGGPERDGERDKDQMQRMTAEIRLPLHSYSLRYNIVG